MSALIQLENLERFVRILFSVSFILEKFHSYQYRGDRGDPSQASTVVFNQWLSHSRVSPIGSRKVAAFRLPRCVYISLVPRVEKCGFSNAE